MQSFELITKFYKITSPETQRELFDQRQIADSCLDKAQQPYAPDAQEDDGDS